MHCFRSDNVGGWASTHFITVCTCFFWFIRAMPICTVAPMDRFWTSVRHVRTSICLFYVSSIVLHIYGWNTEIQKSRKQGIGTSSHTSFRQRSTSSSLSISDLPLLSSHTSSPSVDSPLLPSVTPPLFHFRPTTDSLPAPGLTHGLPDRGL